MKHVFLLPALALLIACGGPGGGGAADGTTDSTHTDTPKAAVIDLGKYDLPLLLMPPEKQLTNGAEPSIVWKDEIGKLAIKAGDQFSLTIMEEPGDVAAMIARVKQDLDRDMVRKNTVLKESPDMLLYKSEFPDNPDLVFIHFYKVVKVGERSFAVEDAQDGTRFTEQDVQRMMEAISPKATA